MRRALVFSALGPESGCALRARYLAEALGENGWETRLLTPIFKNMPLSLEAFLSIPRFCWMALTLQADLAVAIKPYPNCWLALWIARWRGLRVVLDVDDLDHAWRRGFLGWLARAAQSPAFLLLPAFSTHHPAIRAALSGRGELLELGQGIDTKIFYPRTRKAEKLLVFTAHLNIACQFELLFDCVNPWLQRHSDWRLVVAGGGPKLLAWRNQFGSRQIQFTGALDPVAVADWIARARVCLSVYGIESGNSFRVPMKVGEYLAMGKPLVSNLIEGIQPLSAYIYVCKPTARSFENCLDRLAKGRGDGREKLGAAWVQRHLSWNLVVAKFLKALR